MGYMSLEEMNQLADIIVGKLKAMQEDMDKEFFKEVDQFEKKYDVEVEPATDEIIKDKIGVLLEQLDNSLSAAVDAEDYTLANQILKEIEDLKNKEK